MSGFSLNDVDSSPTVAASKGPEFADLYTSAVGGSGGHRLSAANNGSSPYDHLLSSSLGIYDPYRNVAAAPFDKNSVYSVPGVYSKDYHQSSYHHNEVDIDPSENGIKTAVVTTR